MTESQFQAKLRAALQAAMRDSVILKISDRFTAGIPDLMISTPQPLVTWLELKVGKNELTRIQYETLKRLKRGYVVKPYRGKYFIRHIGQWYEDLTKFDSFAGLIAEIVRICRND